MPVVVAARVSSDVEAAHILDVFNGEVAKFKQPKDVIFVNGLPRNAIGKIVVGEIKNLIQSNYWMSYFCLPKFYLLAFNIKEKNK